tara:strand:- start:1484 stop:1684 length:201 start_codon:yes stop_codon:yes gene_type:complete
MHLNKHKPLTTKQREARQAAKNPLFQMSDSEIDTYINAEVKNVAQARNVLKVIVKAMRKMNEAKNG